MPDRVETSETPDQSERSERLGSTTAASPTGDVSISVLVPVWQPDPNHLRQCVESVRNQTYQCSELILVINGPQPKPVDELLVAYRSDPRIRVEQLPENRGIAAATQVALEAATSEFVALLDHDDTISTHALGAFAAEILRFDDVDLAYSDEDKLAPDSARRTMPFYKPSFSMERLRCQMYLGHLLVLRRSLALEVGGFRSEFDGAQDHDLALRMAENARRVVHLPRILYHWRQVDGSTAHDTEAKRWAWEAGTRAIASHLERTGFPALARAHPDAPGVTVLGPRLRDRPTVSIIIPTGGSARPINGVESVLVEKAVSSVVSLSTYPTYEIIVVLDSQASPDVADGIRTAVDRSSGAGVGRSVPALRFVRDRQPFNFARACNLGAVNATGDLLVFLNDDIQIVMSDWLERMVMYAQQPEVGAVGAKLRYGDGRIQHAGVWSREGGPAHRYRGYPGDHPGNFNALQVAQNCLAVTAACLAVERRKFEQVGGFCPLFPLAYNDVDFCLKLYQAGYRNVIDGMTEALHHESSTRDPTVQDWEVALLFRRWRHLLTADPYDNPCNLADGVEEYPPTPVDVAETKAYHFGDFDLTGRSRVQTHPTRIGVAGG